MEARAAKKQTALRLDGHLVDKLKENAKKANRSFSNYVECILLDSILNEPNEDTREAIREARAGKHAGKLDMSDFNSFIKSVNDIE